ncbi:hypothetical protein PIB30_071353 [Stylosanthes scabra]|uniref:Uncharacterized protein n=1 Tax=Stylosanthes scabra TaxID=79078 RepID=A0ABU6YLC1_9FABA|nr:hypothetical protein [Stylosanthes scabra]
MDNLGNQQSRSQHRPSWQDYARQRRQNMSEEQRQQYLARRCASYRERIRRGKEIDVSNDTAGHGKHDNEARPSSRRDGAGQVAVTMELVQVTGVMAISLCVRAQVLGALGTTTERVVRPRPSDGAPVRAHLCTFGPPKGPRARAHALAIARPRDGIKG